MHVVEAHACLQNNMKWLLLDVTPLSLGLEDREVGRPKLKQKEAKKTKKWKMMKMQKKKVKRIKNGKDKKMIKKGRW